MARADEIATKIALESTQVSKLAVRHFTQDAAVLADGDEGLEVVIRSDGMNRSGVPGINLLFCCKISGGFRLLQISANGCDPFWIDYCYC